MPSQKFMELSLKFNKVFDTKQSQKTQKHLKQHPESYLTIFKQNWISTTAEIRESYKLMET